MKWVIFGIALILLVSFGFAWLVAASLADDELEQQAHDRRHGLDSDRWH